MESKEAIKKGGRIERLFSNVPYNWTNGNCNLYNYCFPDITSGLAWLTEKYQEQSGIQCEFRNDNGPIDVDKDINFLLYESASSLLSSIYEVSNPHRISITIEEEGNRVAVSIEEDGIGFDISDEQSLIRYARDHHLSRLNNHLKQIGGTVDVASERGKHTCITLTVPPYASVQ